MIELLISITIVNGLIAVKALTNAVTIIGL